MLKIKKLTVQYGPLAALYEVSLEIEKGEIVSLLGPNGAGKTTLLLTLSGILKTTEGRIIFEEEDITNLSPHQIVSRGIGHVPQGRHIFPTLSVIDNLVMGAYLYRNEKKEMKKDLERIYRLLPGLQGRIHQRAGTLSGGEQQMLSIGRALMGRPKLLLLDEPSMGLAPKVIREIFDHIAGLRAERGVTILLVEQNARAALSIADRGYVLETGRVVLEGSAEDLLANRDVQRAYLGRERSGPPGR